MVLEFRKDEYEDTGIGLAIAYKIVQQYGGAIWVESELNEISIFYFTIPYIFYKLTI